MKQAVSFLLILSFVFSFSSAAFAQEEEKGGPLEKLLRGLTNIVTSPGEILDSVMEDRSGSGMAAGKSHGLLEGISRFFVKASAGVVEVGTFPVPWPNDYAPILDSTDGFKPGKSS